MTEQNNQQKELEVLLNAAQAAYAKGDHATEVDLATQIIQHPVFSYQNNEIQATVYNNRGVAYYNQGKFDLAIADYNKAIELNPKGAEAYNNRGNAYSKQGNLQQAIADYNKAIELNPKGAEVYNNRGIVYYNQGKFDLAIADYNKAIELNKFYPEAYFNRGLAYNKQDKFDQAIRDFDEAIRLNPALIEVYESRGDDHLASGNFEKAIEDFEAAKKNTDDKEKTKALEEKIKQARERLGKLKDTNRNDDEADRYHDFIVNSHFSRLLWLHLIVWSLIAAAILKTEAVYKPLMERFRLLFPKPVLIVGILLVVIFIFILFKKTNKKSDKKTEEDTRKVCSLNTYEFIVFDIAVIVFLLLCFVNSPKEPSQTQSPPITVQANICDLASAAAPTQSARASSASNLAQSTHTTSTTHKACAQCCQPFNITQVVNYQPPLLSNTAPRIETPNTTSSAPVAEKNTTGDEDLSHTFSQWLRYGPFLILWFWLSIANYLRATRELRHYQRSRFILTHLKTYAKDLDDEHQGKFKYDQLTLALSEPEQAYQKDELNLKKLDEVAGVLEKFKNVVDPKQTVELKTKD
jgi:tetratricopeptide (TPR) repeat protein